MKQRTTLLTLAALMVATLFAQNTPEGGQRRRWMRETFETDTPMVHDPVMAYENGTYYLYATGMGVQLMTSTDRKTWTFQRRGALTDIPTWTRDSVPGFRGHVWAPDVIHYRGRWWMAYSCSTFGRNTSAIGLASSPTLDFRDSVNYRWQDHGALVCSREHRDQWNAIDPNFVLDEKGNPVKTEYFNFGKYKGMRVDEVIKRDTGYYGWIMSGDFSNNTKQAITRIYMREMKKNK